jgi:hypothetical protein
MLVSIAVLSLPELSLPELSLPELSLPELSLPEPSTAAKQISTAVLLSTSKQFTGRKKPTQAETAA